MMVRNFVPFPLVVVAVATMFLQGCGDDEWCISDTTLIKCQEEWAAQTASLGGAALNSTACNGLQARMDGMQKEGCCQCSHTDGKEVKDHFEAQVSLYKTMCSSLKNPCPESD